MKNAKKIYAILFAAVMLVGLACPYQPLALLAPASSTATTARVSPVLNFTVIIEQNDPVANKFGPMAVDFLKNLGINATLEPLPFTEWTPRLWPSNPALLGKTYAEGGFDIASFGWINNYADPDPYVVYHTSQFAPGGYDCYLWNNTQNDYLCNRIRHEMNQTKLLQLIQQEQVLLYNETPCITLYYPTYVVPIAKSLNSTPITASYDYSWPAVETWNYTSSPSTNVTVAQFVTDPSNSFVGGFTPGLCGVGAFPCLTVDQALYGPIFGEGSGYGLLMRGAAGTLDVNPYMAYGNYTHSADFRNWNFTIKPGIKFQDGENLDARDVVYTLRYMITPAWAGGALWSAGSLFSNCWYLELQRILGSNTSVYWAGETGTPGASEPVNYYKLHFALPENYSYFLPEICTLPIVPSSVLVNSSSGIPDYQNWHPDPAMTANFHNTAFNTGSGTYSYHNKTGSLCSRNGPFGAGPYRFVDYNSSTSTLHLTEYDGYFNKVALETAGKYEIKDYYVEQISSASDAVAALSAGKVQVLDYNYQFFRNAALISELNSSFCQKILLPGLCVYELGFNMRHPVFGTGLSTPVGMADSSKAAEAAKHMRRGIEYLFLKDTILKNMTNGYASYGVTSAVTPAMFGFDSNIALRNYTTLTQRLLAIKEFEAAGYHFYIDLAQYGKNATTPNWTFDQYGFSITTEGAGNVSVKFYTVAPPGAAGAPNGVIPVVYLDVRGFTLPGSTQTILYVYYNRTRVHALNVSEDNLAIYVWNATAAPPQWIGLRSTYLPLNATTGVIFAVAPHFSYFAVFARTGGGGIGMTTILLIAGVAIIVVAVAVVTVKRRR